MRLLPQFDQSYCQYIINKIHWKTIRNVSFYEAFFKTKWSLSIKNRVNHGMRLFRQSRHLWDFVSSGNITFNIYKLLNRINHGGSGGALLPITSAGLQASWLSPLMDILRGFNHAALGQDPCWSPAERRRTRAWGWTWSTFCTKTQCDSPPRLFPELRSVSGMCR